MENTNVCPVELASGLDTRLRRWLQNPGRLLAPYVHAGMTVLDLGCGPGFFTLDMASLVGPSGRVIACDLQPGMLDKVRHKITGTALEPRIHVHQCRHNDLGLSQPVEFILAFYMLHEIADQLHLFRQAAAILKPGAQMLIVEPPLHVSKKAFARMLSQAQKAGLHPLPGPKMLWQKTICLIK